MIKKYKLFLICFGAIILLFLSSSSVFALEINYYPPIPWYTTPSANCTGSDCLPIYISYWFGFLVYIAGGLAAISFVVGAVQLIMSVESPEAHSSATDRMKGSILGLILTLSAFIILQTINPSLVTPILTPLPGVAGLFYQKGSELKPAPLDEESSSNIPSGYNELIYKCSEDGGGTGPIRIIWKFPKPNFQGNDANYSGVVVVRKSCGETEPITGIGSYRTAFETPGVYFCLGGCNGDMCSGFMSAASTTSGQISEPFKNKIRGIMMVNDIPNNIRYGAILHQSDDPERGGICSRPIIDPDQINITRTCTNVTMPVSSANLFIWNGKTPETSGDGIELYSEPFGWNSGAKAGKKFITKDIIRNSFESQTQLLLFNYLGVDRPEEYIQSYTNFQQRPGSIRINGKYLVALYAEDFYCQVFDENEVPNLDKREFVVMQNKVDYVNIIPTK